MTELQDINVVSSVWSRPIEAPEVCPSSADIVIVGGGIVGVSTAWFLAQDGVNVVVCEKGHIAGEQSSRNWGWIRKQGRDVRELPMMIESHRIWRRFEQETGEDVGYSEGGCYYLATTDKSVEAYESSGAGPSRRQRSVHLQPISSSSAAASLGCPQPGSLRKTV